ncbi:photosynthetic NDH subunit of subcomplex B 3, chloroplastic [Asparagus officinalis]|uniref:photosynthetic NDH subunit of subcomplex B 3, chloroplastic n=1 Tax=Asparagus officinalis TaxID=4686 RepID=UPI00098E2500|nr:photosynthetic NDH subunit of subcomplex B 3, chloroplastic [Asparagus officinalis]
MIFTAEDRVLLAALRMKQRAVGDVSEGASTTLSGGDYANYALRAHQDEGLGTVTVGTSGSFPLLLNGHPSNKLPISLFPKTSSKTSLHQTHQISSLQQPNQPPLKRKRTQCATASSPPEAAEVEEPPSIGFAFVGSRLLPDGTPDIAMRSACGGQKLRDIMLDSHIDLYGPYAKPLSNCAGGGTCGTCLVEVVEGKELLSPRTDIEKEQLKRKPKTWRLACQTTVGNKDSRGEVVIQQLPEWKSHDWE